MTDAWGRSPIHYYGPVDSFPYLSISDILEGKVQARSLRGKIVLIGATAVGIYDLRVTPFSPAMPGVEKHANMIASILENRSVRCAPLPVNLMILLLSGALFSLIIVRFKAVGASGITALYLLLIFFTGFYLFAHNGFWVNITYPSINALLILIGVMGYNYTAHEVYARKIRAMFSSYVTERVVNELIKNPHLARLGGERREVTVLFSDIRGFTTFSEKHSPEEVVAMLNEYLAAMTEVIFRWEGTLDKFVGDEIVAFWGAPMEQENHAELAIKCALNMENRLRDLQQKWSAEGKAILEAGIGINTGEVLVGNIGAEGKKMDYTVIGDHVNLGARVEALTRKYDAHILITEFTLNKIRELVAPGKVAPTDADALGHTQVTGLEKVAVKGKELPVEIYRVKSLDHGTVSIIEEKLAGSE
jgi:adenylate cyclase